jgi:hypothetical protein
MPSAVRRPRRKPVRLCRVFRQGGETFLRLTIDGKVTDYRLTPLSSDMGRAFRVEKLATGSFVVEDTYDVNIGGNDTTCGCKGFARWHHCKHCESLTNLIDAGRI